VVAEGGAAKARAIALRRFDLDNISAQERHQLRCKRSSNSVAAFNHTEIVKWQALHRLSGVAAMIQDWYRGFFMRVQQTRLQWPCDNNLCLIDASVPGSWQRAFAIRTT
jgi:hypothetical protein